MDGRQLRSQLHCIWDHTHGSFLVGTVDLLRPISGGGGGGDDEFFFDFEDDDGGWIPDTIVGDWEWTNTYDVSNYVYGEYPTSEKPPQNAYSGTGLWGTVMYAPYTNSGSDTTLSRTFDFTGMSNVQISWRSWENAFGDWDHCNLYVNGDLDLGSKLGFHCTSMARKNS